jgi:predicted small lipoprotein YifL
MKRLSLFALALALAAAGCGSKGPELYPVSGKVLVNNKPAEHATVVLHPVNGSPDLPKPRGTVGPDGSFALTTHSAGDGAPPGEYRVTVELWLSSGKGDEGPTSRLPAKYAKPERSGLTASVGHGPTELKSIEIKR